MKNAFYSFAAFLLSMTAFAQYNYRDSNRIGIIAGVNQIGLYTSDFDVKSGMGWNAGLSVRGNYYDNWDMVYAVQFSEVNFDVPTYNSLSQPKNVNYKFGTVQISLQLSKKIFGENLTLEFGPIIQLNGKMEIDREDKQNTIKGTTLKADDITEITNYNIYPTAGITFGVTHFRANISYQYGLINMFSRVDNVKGNMGILNGNLIIYL
ncbi:outer membrane beta-barrel protein [Flavobacterium sp. 3HN19-14]|uniref:outer membrane beta-barrel protein n=1 Tax=Flavobacterium sp. 3HN19-14 TaxID=3448133 RepID=UPI003EDFDD0A